MNSVNLKKYWPLFLYLGLAYLFYYPTIGAGFIGDFIGFLARVEEHGPGGFIHSFGFPALQPVLNAFLISFYQIFGMNGLPWYIIFTGIHALNAYLVFKLALRLSDKHLKDTQILWPLIAGLIFLLSPYQSEAIVWKVCFNFLFSSFSMLTIFLLLLKYIEDREKKWRILSIGLYCLAILTFELPIIFPFLLLVYLFLFHEDNWKSFSLQFIAPLLAVLICYFLGNKFILGDWVGHYGADTHLNLDLKLMIKNAYKYAVKHLGFVRMYPHEIKNKVLNFCNHPIAFYGLVTFSILSVVLSFVFRKKWTASTKLISFSFLGFFLSLAPILNLFFYVLMNLENDRYGYFPTVFLSLFIIFLLRKLPRILGLGMVIIYLSFSSFYLVKINSLWSSSNKIIQGLYDDYHWDNEEQVFLLTLPENLYGVYMFRDHSGQYQSFYAALKYLDQREIKGQITEIIQYNLTNESNGATVKQISPNQIKVELNHWGSWWWRKNYTNSKYETDLYSFAAKDKHYVLTFKKEIPDAVFLYHDGLTWKEFKFDPSSPFSE